ncbi:MAG: YabP/YqfC family sporulation protein [Clostridia bacterium]|nr:YabP/YqfC family sporulation protein [Clostridia bacterium]
MKNCFFQFLNDKLELPVDGVFDTPNVQMIGNYVLNLEGCIGIKKYETTEVILRCKKYLICVFGKELTMLTFSQGRICIRGEIFRYEIERV